MAEEQPVYSMLRPVERPGEDRNYDDATAQTYTPALRPVERPGEDRNEAARRVAEAGDGR